MRARHAAAPLSPLPDAWHRERACTSRAAARGGLAPGLHQGSCLAVCGVLRAAGLWFERGL
eukprot:6948435-Prymnesium_polylepis.1